MKKTQEQIEANRMACRRYKLTAKGKATVKRYWSSAEGKAARKRYRNSAKGKAANKRYDSSAKGKAAHNGTKKRWVKRNPEKVRAHKAVYRAKKNGELVLGPCIKCGDPHTEAHHPDYSRSLVIESMCHHDHIAEHLAKGNC